MFEQTLLQPHATKTGATFLASFGIQSALVATALVIPLFMIAPPDPVLLHLSLAAPPPPPPPPSFVKLVQVPAQVVQRFFDGTKLLAPRSIPDKPLELTEAEPAIGTSGTGVQGGTGVGVPDGVIGSIASHRVAPPPPPPAPTEVKAEPVKPKEIPRIRQGGDVQLAMLLNRVIPVYPPLAKAGRIQGTVRLTSVIDREGRVVQLQVISGHPLLVKAALEAVRQWRYRPTMLNSEPVEVIAPIDVHFTLSN